MPSQEVSTRLPLGQKPKSLCAVPPMSCSRAWLGLGLGFGFGLGLGLGLACIEVSALREASRERKVTWLGLRA